MLSRQNQALKAPEGFVSALVKGNYHITIMPLLVRDGANRGDEGRAPLTPILFFPYLKREKLFKIWLHPCPQPYSFEGIYVIYSKPTDDSSQITIKFYDFLIFCSRHDSNRIHLLELSVGAYLFFIGCYDLAFGKNGYFLYLFLQSFTFFIAGIGYVGTFVPNS